MQIGGALVKAITRFAAPAVVAGGHVGTTAVVQTGAVVGGELGGVPVVADGGLVGGTFVVQGLAVDVVGPDDEVDALDEVDEVLDEVVLDAAGLVGLLPASRNTMSTIAATTSASAPPRR
jgi:hypothetical protein